jgi:hypothetical protein
MQARKAAADAKISKQQKARAIWRRRRPIEVDTPPYRYLRNARGYSGPIPSTIGFLPAWRDFPPAMVAAIGFASEPEPGTLSIDDEDVNAVHITHLLPDGSGKAPTEPNKIMIGAVRGSPIVLAPPNDLGGLAITEGIEDALSVTEATGLGAWAAGSASFLPALADAVPEYIECVTVMVHSDPDGIRYSRELVQRLRFRGFEVRPVALQPECAA